MKEETLEEKFQRYSEEYTEMLLKGKTPLTDLFSMVSSAGDFWKKSVSIRAGQAYAVGKLLNEEIRSAENDPDKMAKIRQHIQKLNVNLRTKNEREILKEHFTENMAKAKDKKEDK